MIQSVLIFSHGELVGDGMIKMPFIRALPLAFPKAKITWVSGRHPTVFSSALQEMTTPYLHNVFSYTKLGDRFFDVLRKSWKKFALNPPYDLIINTERKLIPTLMLKTIPHRQFISFAYNGFLSDIKPILKSSLLLLDNLMHLLNCCTSKKIHPVFEFEIPSQWMKEAQRILSSFLGQKKIILLAPGAGGRFKCWPLKNFIALASKLKKDGHIPMFILGPNEIEWKSIIEKALPWAFFPLQQTKKISVFLTIAFGKLSDAIVVNDAGVGHILASSNTPTVSLWGPTDCLKSKPNGMCVHIIKAEDFGKKAMNAIPINIVNQAIQNYL